MSKHIFMTCVDHFVRFNPNITYYSTQASPSRRIGLALLCLLRVCLREDKHRQCRRCPPTPSVCAMLWMVLWCCDRGMNPGGNCWGWSKQKTTTVLFSHTSWSPCVCCVVLWVCLCVWIRVLVCAESHRDRLACVPVGRSGWMWLALQWIATQDAICVICCNLLQSVAGVWARGVPAVFCVYSLSHRDPLIQPPHVGFTHSCTQRVKFQWVVYLYVHKFGGTQTQKGKSLIALSAFMYSLHTLGPHEDTTFIFYYIDTVWAPGADAQFLEPPCSKWMQQCCGGCEWSQHTNTHENTDDRVWSPRSITAIVLVCRLVCVINLYVIVCLCVCVHVCVSGCGSISHSFHIT